MQAINIFGPNVFQKFNGSKYQGGFDTTLWDTVMLTLERYDRADLQPKADALRAELEHLKAASTFVPKAGEKLSRRSIEARIGVFANSIDAVTGMQRHAKQPRSFSEHDRVSIQYAMCHRYALFVVITMLHGLLELQPSLYKPGLYQRKQLLDAAITDTCVILQKMMFDADPHCSACGQQILQLGDAEVDHRVPYSEGGKTEPSNAQLLHRLCNRQKSNKMPIDADHRQCKH